MKNKLLVQDNALTTARYEMTAIEKNIMYAVMSQIEDTDSPLKYYEISSSEMSIQTHKRLKNGEFEKAITRLLTRDFTIKAIDGLIQSTFIASAKYKTNGQVEIEISTRLRPYLFALKKNFTTFGLEVAMSLNSKYAKRLYEMLCQFKNTGLIRVSIQELKERFQLISTEGVEQYARWSSFEENVLLVAQTEINEKAEFQFDYHLKREGRKITAVEFVFRKPTTPSKTETVAPVIAITPVISRNARMIERLTDYGFNAEQVMKVTAKHTEKVINKQLYELDCNKETVKHPTAYLLKIFEI